MASEHFDVWLENAIEGVSVQAEDISIPQFRILTCKGHACEEMIHAGELQTKKLQEMKKKPWRKFRSNPARLRDRLDAPTIWATKPHAESQENVSEFLFLVNESDHN